MKDLLQTTLHYAQDYLAQVNERPVFPTPEAIAQLSHFVEAFPTESTEATQVLGLLHDYGAPATVASTGGRYFGFVTGGILPTALAASWLMAVWDQNAALNTMSPIGAKLEEIALNWLVEVLGLPQGTGGGFVTGATMANFSALAAARHYLLERVGWDVEARGLYGAPEIKIVVGDEVHVSVLQAIMMLGFGRERVVRVPVDSQGRMRADALPELDSMTILCIQAGNVNTGSFDPAAELCEKAHQAGAWVHVDAAFGLWALVSPQYAPLANGVTQADSWATDGHKWLNVSYDNGLVFCRYPQALRDAFTLKAPYLVQDNTRQGSHYTPERSRRARGIEVWAVLKALGRTGLAEMIERCCQLAQRFAEGLRKLGYTIPHEVVLNQVLVIFEDAETTERMIQAIQADGTFWAGRSVWQGQVVMRISVSSWATTEADIDQCLAAIQRLSASLD